MSNGFGNKNRMHLKFTAFRLWGTKDERKETYRGIRRYIKQTLNKIKFDYKEKQNERLYRR